VPHCISVQPVLYERTFFLFFFYMYATRPGVILVKFIAHVKWLIYIDTPDVEVKVPSLPRFMLREKYNYMYTIPTVIAFLWDLMRQFDPEEKCK